MNNVNKWFLIYQYHDMNFCEFNSKDDLLDYLIELKERYYGDNDFKYIVINGNVIKRGAGN